MTNQCADSWPSALIGMGAGGRVRKRAEHPEGVQKVNLISERTSERTGGYRQA